jgi:hypothetical protein
MRDQNQYEVLPDEDRERYRTLAAALIEHGGGALADLDGMIVKGDDIVKDYVWIGYLKGKSSKLEAQQKVCHHQKGNDYTNLAAVLGTQNRRSSDAGGRRRRNKY